MKKILLGVLTLLTLVGGIHLQGGIAQTITISGSIVRTSDNTPVSGVVMNGLPDNPTTDVHGSYSAAIPYGWSGKVAPKKIGYAIHPPSKNYTNVTSSITDDYRGTILPKVALRLDKESYYGNEPIMVTLTIENQGIDIVTTQGFASKDFTLALRFTDPDEKLITANLPPGAVLPTPLAPPAVATPTGESIPADYVEILPGKDSPTGFEPWVWSNTFNALDSYTLAKPGNYSVKAKFSMSDYLDDYYETAPGSGVFYSPLDSGSSGDVESNTVLFALASSDADKDKYCYPSPCPGHEAADCNDNDPNEHPNQTWYKDEDNDGYSDGTTNPTSCTRPSGYKTASELLGGIMGDCNDNNPNVNPRRTEVVCNGVDDDCNSATPDVSTPTLASPQNGATNVSTTPTLSWNAVSCATSYHLQVSTSDTFGTMVVDQSPIMSPSYSVPSGKLSNNTTYYWRVNGSNAAGPSAWSSPWSFTTVAAAPAVPTLVSPTNGATGVSITPTLSWNASSGATSYGLQVSTSQTDWSGSNLKVNQSGINGTSYTVPSGKLIANTTYYWRANATNAGGTSAWSSPWRFTTIAGKTYLLTVKKAGTGSGTVTADPGPLIWNGNTGTASYPAGTKVTLTALANTGSTFSGWSAYCSGSGNCSVVIIGSKCTVNMCGPCNATATFTIKTYTITATAGTGGKITPSGSVKVNHGADKTFTITPYTGYQISNVKVDGVSKGAIGSYTFTNVTANHTISATFIRR